MAPPQMGLQKLLRLVCILVMVDLAGSVVTIHFLEAPQKHTRFSTAVFHYLVETLNGTNACENNLCSFSCELDGQILRPCPPNVVVLKNLTVNKMHSFLLNVTTHNGERGSSSYSWLIDTVSPTATISSKESYTNARRVTINVMFSEPCPGYGGFKCLNSSSCVVIVNGPAYVQASSLRIIKPDVNYNLDIILSTKSVYGRVLIRMADNFCTDKAGNLFTRTNASIVTIHFDRRPVTVDLWMPVPSYVLEINGVLRTVLATNKMEDLTIFLDFSLPIRNSTEQVLNAVRMNSGNVVPVHVGNQGNRKFVFELKNVSSTKIITVELEAGLLVGRTGTPVSPVSSIAILYDIKPPEVGLSTSTPSVTKASKINVIVEFSKPVFGFDSSVVDIKGGRVTRFKELSRALYSLHVLAETASMVSITVPAGKVNDISGNQNLASNRLELNHYSTPAISLALHSFVTAGVLATSLAAAALSLSSANLVTIGTLSLANTNNVASSPSVNLHGLIGHLQVFVLSDWFSANHPVEYSETTEGLKWLIPRQKLPWEEGGTSVWANHVNMNEEKFSNSQLVVIHYRRYYHFYDLNESNSSYDGHQLPLQTELRTHALGLHGINVSMESAQYGLPLNSEEYFTYFLRAEPLSTSNVVKRTENYTGWQDLEMNLFWLGVGGGCLLIIHVLILLFLRWRTGTKAHGILSVPRFELLLLILSLPNISQSSAFVIRGGTMGGIITAAFLLVIPAAFILSVCLFLTLAIFPGNLAQYKEIRNVSAPQPQSEMPRFLFTGRPVTGKWLYREGLPSTFLPRFGILFEDRKGPPLFVYIDQNDPSVTSNWIESGRSGIGRMRAISSEDSNIEFKVPTRNRILGCARCSYIVLDLLRRTGLGVLSGAFSSPAFSQNLVALMITSLQFIYLSTLKPYIRRGVHVAESISLLCEVGIFGLLIVTNGSNTMKATTLGYSMLSLLLITFIAQITNEWYTLTRSLLRLSPPHKKSFKLGLRFAAKGLLLPFLPRKLWTKVIPSASQPKAGLSNVPPLSPERESGRVARIDTFGAMTATVVPVISPGTSPGMEVAQTESSFTLGGQRGAGEGERGKELKAVDKSELKQLRKLAKASFFGHPAGEEGQSSKYKLEEQLFYPRTFGGHQEASTSETRH